MMKTGPGFKTESNAFINNQVIFLYFVKNVGQIICLYKCKYPRVVKMN